MAKQPTPKVITKKHLARLERERLQQRYLLIGLGVTVVLIVAILLYGFLDQAFFQQMRPVAKVGTETISTGEFQKEVRFSRYRLIQQLSQFAADPIYLQFFGSYITQLVSQLQTPTAVGQETLDSMIEAILVEKKAKELGITIDEAELDKAVEAAFGYYENGTPTPTITATPYSFSTATLSPEQLALIGPSATPAPTEVPAEPTITAQAQATATAEVAAATATAQFDATATAESIPTATPEVAPTATEVPTITPTPTQYTRELYQQNFDDYAAAVKDLKVTKEDLRVYIRRSMLREKVFEALTKDVSAEAEQVWARHILVRTQEEAQAVIDRLNAGENFADVAREVSVDDGSKEQGGDLDWFTREMMIEEFSNAAFQLNVGQISQPVETTEGWHVIQVLGKETRPLTAEQLDQAKQAAYADWLEQAKEEADVTTYENWTAIVPTDPEIPAALLNTISQYSQGQ